MRGVLRGSWGLANRGIIKVTILIITFNKAALTVLITILIAKSHGPPFQLQVGPGLTVSALGFHFMLGCFRLNWSGLVVQCLTVQGYKEQLDLRGCGLRVPRAALGI